MLVGILDALLAEEKAIRAIAVFDDLGSLVVHTNVAHFDEEAFLGVVRAWRSAKSDTKTWSELRLERPDRAFVARAVGPALVAADVDAAAPLGRIATRLRLLHDPILGALP
jgi:hypothetical protein